MATLLFRLPRPQKRTYLLSALLTLLVCTTSVAQITRYVSTTGNTPAASATSWAASTSSLQGAIDYVAANGGGEVRVAAGTYKPTTTTGPDSRTISFAMKNGVAIYGGFAGNETSLNQRPAIKPAAGMLPGSILSGEIGDPLSTTDNSLHVISNPSGLTTTAVLDGFVISGGNANGSNSPDNVGGGVYNDGTAGCSPVFRNCILQNNAAAQGGAMYNYSGVNVQSGPVLTSCILQSNSATAGGAMYNYGNSFNSQSSPVLTNCILQSNSAVTGGAMYNYGTAGGMSNPVLTNCTLQSNSAATGGAMLNEGNSGDALPVLTNCVFWRNGNIPFVNTYTSGASATYSLFDNPANVNTSGSGNLTTTTSPFESATSVALAPCSPAINTGDPTTTTTTAGATDLAGNPRIVGAQIDMGAIESQSLPVGLTPLPASATAVCSGERISLPASVTGSPAAYQWYRNGSPVTSQTAATLSIPQAGTADAGSYSLVVTGACNSVTSTAFSLTVNTLPSVTVTALPSTTLSCTNPSLTLTAQTSATAFAWSNAGSIGQTLPVSQSGVYSVTVTDGNGCTAVSNSLTVAQDNTSPTVSISAISNQLTCAQPQLTLTATTSATALHWSTSQTTNAISVSQTGTYSVTATGANGCSAVSNNLIIGQDFSLPPFTISSATVCPGQTINLTASGCSGQILWSTGATTAMITLTAGSSTSALTATCTVGTCSTTASGQVVAGGIQPPPAQILSFTADESACPVRLTARGVASSFTMTGPKNYVFSTVYREGATHEAIGLNVKLAGTYTLTATYTNSCGTSAPVTRTVTVTRNCP